VRSRPPCAIGGYAHAKALSLAALAIPVALLVSSLWCLAVDAFAQLTNVACRGNGGRGRAAARACSQAGQKWHDTPPGLPNVTVTDLVLVPERGVLYAGTHGQGVWQLKVH
jgi:hypothetical protein